MTICKTVQDMNQLMDIGNASRTTGETLMNKDSSRSHSIFTCYVEISEKDSSGTEKLKSLIKSLSHHLIKNLDIMQGN